MTPLKVCSKCGIEQDISSFHNDRSRPSGIHPWCKTCMKVCQRAWIANNLDLKRAAGRRTYHKNKARWKSKSGGTYYDPAKKSVRNKVQNLVRRGKLLRQPCSVCGQPKAEMHHSDYSKPFDVVWLCKQHHGTTHRIYTDADNQVFHSRFKYLVPDLTPDQLKLSVSKLAVILGIPRTTLTRYLRKRLSSI